MFMSELRFLINEKLEKFEIRELHWTCLLNILLKFKSIVNQDQCED